MTRCSFSSLFLLFAVLLFAAPSEAVATWVSIPGAQSSASPFLVQVEQKAAGEITVHLLVFGFENTPLHDNGTRFANIVLPGAGSLREPGRPALPVVAVPLLLEAGFEVLDIRTSTRLIEDVVPAPFVARPKRCASGGWRLTCDTQVYAQAEPFPAEAVVIRESGKMRGADAVLLELRPFRFLPHSRALEVAYRIEVDLAARLFHAGEVRLRSNAFRQIQLSGFYSDAKPFKREEVVREGMLIIAHDYLLSALGDFIAWKQHVGMKVVVAPLSETGSTYQEVQQFIADAYANWEDPPVYVLLVGDGSGAGKVPFVPSPLGCASDFLYSTLDGDDLYSDVLVGRFSAHDVAEAQLQIAKSVWYEKSVEAYGPSSWLARSVCISSSEGAGSSNDDVRSDIVCGLQEEHGYEVTDKLYHSIGNDKASIISEKVNDGRGWLTYLGHGSGHDWSTTDPPYGISHIQALENVHLLPFIVDVSCSNGAFGDSGGDCFAEAWMKTGSLAAPRAAIGIYSSSTPTAWDEPAEMAVGMTHALLEQGIYNWGALAAAGRAYMMDVLPAGELEEVCHQYVVFGDPSLMVRTREAMALEVEHGTALPLGGVEFPVSVKSAGQEVAQATVAMKLPGGAYVVAKTNDQGEAVLWPNAEEAGTAELTVFAANSIPYQAEIETLVPGCGLVLAKPSAANCGTTLEITVYDGDLNTSKATKDEAMATVSSSTDPISKNVPLVESDVNSGKFVGTVELSEDAGQFQLGVKHGDTVEVAYADAGCEGAPKEEAAWVEIDCQAPVISNIQVPEIGALSAVVSFVTDEPASARVRYGQDAPPGTELLLPTGTVHVGSLLGLSPSAEYLAEVEATDASGNLTLDENQGDYYQFSTEDCEPECQGAQCGFDGCGGECGGCCETQVCVDGSCVGGPGCEAGYDAGCGGCPCEDCVCGADPYCCTVMWDDLCAEQCVAQCGGCGVQANCVGKDCGPNGCGGVCGECPADWTCTDSGLCVEECEPECQEHDCGLDGCGGSCGTCQAEAVCTDGTCLVPCNAEDFVGCCDGQEHVYCDEGFEFKMDCSEKGLKCGWKDFMGWYDCVDEQAADPSGKYPLWCPGTCPPQCDDKVCGPDGCGGECGKCSPKEMCDGGQCVLACKPDCDGKECGGDGCDGSCGECPIGLACDLGECISSCIVQCDGKQCGDNGCGGVCGKCAPGMECSADYLCVVPSHTPDIVAIEEAEPIDLPPAADGGCSVRHRAAAWPIPLALTGLVLLLLLGLRRRRVR